MRNHPKPIQRSVTGHLCLAVLCVLLATGQALADDKDGRQKTGSRQQASKPHHDSRQAKRQDARDQASQKAAVPMSKQAREELDKQYAQKYHYQSNPARLIRCESRYGRQQFCPADTRFGVNLERQLSRANCAGNWGYDQRGIWVRNGCAADFSINSDWNSGDDWSQNLIRCESEGYKERYCPAQLGGRDVILVRQLSRSSCDGNWGYDRNGIWVDNGCRAEFALDDRYSQQGDLLVCSSERHRFKRCPVDTRWGVEFVRQLSRSSCQGNWGYDEYGIWVDNGCRAQFRVEPPPPPPPVVQENPYPDRIRCSSRHGRYRLCRVDTGDGVELVKQHSRASCRGNWGYNRDGVWVDNGCRATFRIKRSHHGYGPGSRPYGNRPYGTQPYGNQPYGNQPYGNRPGNKPPPANRPYGNTGPGQSLPAREEVRCDSINGKYRVCPVQRPFATVRLVRQHSRASCAGHWGQVPEGIWVDKGCRATFRVER